ncbi:MAG: hypothetical protein M3P30_01810 [Chloroflexota bacterium]|nr:hypothetical protein [Chloroflexota bacterium]
MKEHPVDRLFESSRQYYYKRGDLPACDQKWKIFREQGSMTFDELAEVSRWKTGGRQDQNIALNSDKAVRAVTTAAISVAREVPGEPGIAVGILTALHGVELPTASTVMTVWKPERFGILDIRAWHALCRAAPAVFARVESKAGNRRPFRLEEANTYLRVIREVAALASLNCREVDKALYMLGKP